LASGGRSGLRIWDYSRAYRFAPRINDLKDRRLYTTEKPSTWPILAPLIGDTVETAAILGQWIELMRLKVSIETGAVVPSAKLRRLAAAGAGNALSRALRALGWIELNLFTLQWLSDPMLRQRSHAGRNKGEANNALRRAAFFHRQEEIRDRTFENQSFRASGPSLATAAIVDWNMVSLDRVVQPACSGHDGSRRPPGPGRPDGTGHIAPAITSGPCPISLSRSAPYAKCTSISVPGGEGYDFAQIVR
jgi:TnpA family transposase